MSVEADGGERPATPQDDVVRGPSTHDALLGDWCQTGDGGVAWTAVSWV